MTKRSLNPRLAVRQPAWRAATSFLLALFLLLPPRFTALGGDILRGGGVSGQSRSAAFETANPPAAAVQAGISGPDTLARTTQALNAVMAMQAAAHAAAVRGANNLGQDQNHHGQILPNVPNGLTSGGLQIAPDVVTNKTLWQGANLPTQRVAGGQTTVTVKQNIQDALLNWQTFNIGKQTRLTFDQTAGGGNASQWIAFNKVNDPSGVPSLILGALDAIGQVYVINPNGIIFGGSSQVNLHTLVASALPINDNLITRGLLNNPDNQFLFSALPIPSGTNGTPAFVPPPSNTPDGHYGDVVVQEGAVITSPTMADHVGGRVALIGANTSNSGTISTPDAQTILASGLQVGFGAHATNDPSLRGLDVFVGAIASPGSEEQPYAGRATNFGLIDAPRGDTTIAGSLVNQLGFINSSTSVALNGRIDLLADYNAEPNTNTNAGQNPPPFVFTSSGTITLGRGSVMQIVPETTSTERVVGAQLALQSQINLQGLVIHADSDSTIFAPSANVTLSAGVWIPTGGTNNLMGNFVFSDGQIYFNHNALIDVSGLTGVSASVSENIISAQLLGPELANSPLQRNGPLRGQTIHVDIRDHGVFDGTPWVGTPLADVSGYVNLVQRTVAELSINGGTVNLNAGSSVVLQRGADIDISGGSIDYQGAFVQTSRVVSSDGHIFDIAQATPDRVYSGLYTGSVVDHSKWGIVEVFANPLAMGGHFEPSYVQGANGGAINVSAPAMALDGTLQGNTIAGPRQLAAQPAPSSLTLNFRAQDPNDPLFSFVSPTPPHIVFSGNNNLTPADPFALDANDHPLPLRVDRQATVILSPALVNVDGFGNLRINNGDGDITVPGDVTLTTPMGGSISFAAANADIEGSILAPGGNLSFTAYTFSPFAFAAPNFGNHIPSVDPSRGIFTLGSNALLNTAGSIIDDRAESPTANLFPISTNGGSVTISSYSADIAAGSQINVSGGVRVDSTGTATYGNAGSISISAGQDPNVKALLDGHLRLDGQLLGFAGANGGSLSLLAPFVQVGGTTQNPDLLLLSPGFFSNGGFTNFNISGIGAATNAVDEYVPAVVIAPNVTIAPVAQSFIAAPNTAGNISLAPELLTPGLRNPVSLAFGAPGVTDIVHNNVLVVRGDLIMSRGSTIRTDPLANVTLNGQTTAALGSIIAPAGNITIKGGGNSVVLFTAQTNAVPTVEIGPDSLLSVAGTTLLTPNSLGLRLGSVLAGGTITVNGNIVAEAGSHFDVSGATDMLDLPASASGELNATQQVTSGLFVRTRVDSNAGAVLLNGAQELFTDATFAGAAGGPSAQAGSLTISSGRFYPLGAVATPLDVTLTVTQIGPTIPAPFFGAGETAIGHAVVDENGNPLPQLGHFTADDFNASGMGSVILGGTVEFASSVRIDAPRSIAVGSGGVIYGNAAISLNAPYVALGTNFQPPLEAQQILSAFVDSNSIPFFFPPVHGQGALNVNARLIDLGNLSLQSIGTANLIASSGDVRGDGTLDIAGNLNIRAGQIYPPTATSFTLAAYDYVEGSTIHLGSITINRTGARQLPLSAGGQLDLEASIINQGGVVRAPVGAINIGWNGSGTAPIDLITGQPVPVAQQVTLAPGSITSVSAVDPITHQALVVPYGVNQNGTAWIAPNGLDITASGVPEKSIAISAGSVFDSKGSVIDLRGGGDLFAYQFNPGVGGTIDLLNSSTTFAVVPGYRADYAPFAPYNPNPIDTNFGNAAGYTNNGLAVGDRVFLNGGGGLLTGNYTLLPARYALLPGAFLVTPQSSAAIGSSTLPDGSAVVLGYRFNDLDWLGTARPINTAFEIASANVLSTRAPYIDFSANSFLKQSAVAHDVAIPRLPVDSGHLLLDAVESMRVQGSLISQAADGGRGGEVDIESPVDILISGSGTSAPGMLVLNAAELSSFGAESLLIGGARQTAEGGASVNVTTNNLIVDNSGTPLTGQDITLVANETLTLASGAEIESSGPVSHAETLLFGNASGGNGDGVLVRASSDPQAMIVRTSLSSSTSPALSIGSNARISGGSVTLDSTNATTLSSSARLDGSFINLNSGRISIQLNDPGRLPSDAGLVLAGTALGALQRASLGFSLLSYTSIDIYGHGQVGSFDSSGTHGLTSLALHTGAIRGFNSGSGVLFAARDITLDNSPAATAPAPIAEPAGALSFDAQTIHLGERNLEITQFASVALNAGEAIIAGGTGKLTTQANLLAHTPLITGATGAQYSIVSSGLFSIEQSSGGDSATIIPGLAVQLTLEGSSIIENSNIVLPSGALTLHATAQDVSIGGTIDVEGAARTFFDTIHYTDAGEVSLISDSGNVRLTSNAIINLSAQPAAGNAGTLLVSVKEGSFTESGRLFARGAAAGEAGNFLLDTRTLPSLAALDAALDAAGFTQSRTFRIRSGNVLVDGIATAHTFDLSADNGAITVSGTINASGAVAGSIDLSAHGDVTLLAGANLSVAGSTLDAAEKGGTIALETTNGRIRIRSGSTLDLSVANRAGGTLHLRAPQTFDADVVAIDPLLGNIHNAASIIAEGVFVQDASTPGAASIDTMESVALDNATEFMTHMDQIQTRLLAGNSSLVGVLQVLPGEEIDNSQGGLILNHDWDLSTWRFGERKAVVDDAGHPLYDSQGNQIFSRVEPGVLTLRAQGSIILHGILNDGFGDGAGAIDYPLDENGHPALWKETLLPRFADGTSQQSWSYRITAGADFAAADLRQTLPLGALGDASGSLEIGVNSGVIQATRGRDATTEDVISGYYQVIRTGTGDIEISAGRDVQLLNPFATIYTAGTLAGSQTLNGAFDLPHLNAMGGEDALGAVQESPAYPAQYTSGGGNITIIAQHDIIHLTQDSAGHLIADSEKQLPNNWLYRRSYVDPVTGEFGVGRFGDVESTTWWVDFSNFFEGIGALGGGNVTMRAGNNVSNVDAVVPTNARMPKGAPDVNSLVELGGGNLWVTAGHDVDGGVYYVERGQGIIRAGNSIHTNSTRSPSLTTIVNPPDISPEQTWLPTTLFLGKGSFDVSARGDVLLGPVANPFLLPGGYSNTFWYKTYFSTYAATDSVAMTSLTGSVTLRQSTTLPGGGLSNAEPLLQAWLENVSLLPQSGQTVALYQPWLRLDETSIAPFSTLVGLMPPALRATAFTGDVNLVGDIALSPSAQGTLDVVAAGSINGFQPSGVITVAGVSTASWSASTINVSDADPKAVPGIASPLAYQLAVGTRSATTASNSQLLASVLTPINNLFAESGSISGIHAVLQAKQALHAAGVLHRDDPQVIHLYADSGNISGLTLFSPTVTRIIAGHDITDIAFYLQNVDVANISVVAAGRDLIAFDPNSALRTAAQSPGNALSLDATPLAGDIQISGPGALEVFAGRNFDLGVGPSNADGTGVGVTSIGNARNPSLRFGGADIIAGAGIGLANSLNNSALDFATFIDKFLNPSSAFASRYLPELGKLLGLANATNDEVWNQFQQLTIEDRDRFALDVFYFVLRDAGRDHNDPSSTSRNYEQGYAAISALFPGDRWQGDISLTSREIKTKNGGNISIFAPGGGLTVGFDLGSNQPVDQGILTEAGGNISLFTRNSVNVGTSRIFTLRGGNEIIWSTLGDIAAGSAPKTVQAAPPTRVLIDPQSGDVATDLAGLATGGGIGVLESVAGVAPGDVDLIAPAGTVNAGDAGIRVSGNLNVAAVQIVNAGNIQVGGASAGIPVVAAPNVGGLTTASSASAATANAANELATQNRQPVAQEEGPSIITVEVIGYGGSEGNDDEEQQRRQKARQPTRL